jgi:hypothetical protein
MRAKRRRFYLFWNDFERLLIGWTRNTVRKQVRWTPSDSSYP